MDREEQEKRILKLLEESLIADAIKDILKKNLKKYSDDVLGGISESLGREYVSAEKLAYELMAFDAASQKRWDDLAKNELTQADAFVEKAFNELRG